MMNTKRVLHFDVIKFICIMWIFFTHFIEEYQPDLFSYWHEGWTKWILIGVTGKAAIAMFAVILGYFAFLSARNSESLLVLFFKRYIFFVVIGLVANTINSLTNGISVLNVLISSFLLKSDVFPTFWFLRSFFIGSCFSYVNGKYNVGCIGVAIEAISIYFCDGIWESICVLGNILPGLLNCDKIKKIYDNKFLFIITLFVAFIVIKREECNSTYFLDGISSLLFLFLIECAPKIKFVFQRKIMASLGKNCMGILVLHTVVYEYIGNYLFNLFSSNAIWPTFFMVFLICVCIVLPLATVLMRIINYIVSLSMTVFAPMIRKIEFKLNELRLV